MSELKPCPFCGAKAQFVKLNNGVCYVRCPNFCSEQGLTFKIEEEAIEAWNRRTPESVKVETNIFDKEEIFPDCTVQVLTTTATGETRVGWGKNGN